ncbi:unnamed protein product [Echinostoma caproni]|uniref:Uncharacterized protein n=1 Tax=Echinostoma caproni TaxID=27848 RepID=A0A3P8LA85_9TREM|nr:unnamed protein product [Echinostoma caproni]
MNVSTSPTSAAETGIDGSDGSSLVASPDGTADDYSRSTPLTNGTASHLYSPEAWLDSAGKLTASPAQSPARLYWCELRDRHLWVYSAAGMDLRRTDNLTKISELDITVRVKSAQLD